MNKENKEYMFKTYPKIFPKNMRKNANQGLMFFGFEHYDGWFNLINTFCKCVQSYIDNNKHLNIPQMIATQVKQKFGGLRFYYSGGNEKIHGMCRFLEYLSFTICEYCGKPGTTDEEGYIETLCEECRNERNNNKK